MYCHSGLPDDLGIQYQSYSKTDIVAEDDYLRLLPGVGHTGSEPFDEVHGWYRSYRGLAGSVHYHMRWKGWSPERHREFPEALRCAVRTMLLCNLNAAVARSLLQLESADVDSRSITNSSSSSMNDDDNNNHSLVSADSAAAAAFLPSDAVSTTQVGKKRRLTLASLPVYVVYNILEFMVG